MDDGLHAEPPPPVAPRFTKIAFVASSADEARTAARRLSHTYGNVPLDQADVVVALGGDGLMLEALHRLMDAPWNVELLRLRGEDAEADAMRDRLASLVHDWPEAAIAAA